MGPQKLDVDVMRRMGDHNDFIFVALRVRASAPASRSAHSEGPAQTISSCGSQPLRTPTSGVMIDASIADRSAPEVLEPMRRQLGVPNGMLDVLVPEPSL